MEKTEIGALKYFSKCWVSQVYVTMHYAPETFKM